jgi:hypothetical protein
LSEEKIEFTRPFLIWGNLALLAWVLLAFFALWFYNQIYGWLLLVFTSAAIYMILRRLGCSSCYYCKSCTSGFGRLAGAFFGTRYTKKGSVGNRKGFIVFIYFLLAPLPAAFLILSTFQAFTALKGVVLFCLLAVTFCSVLTWSKETRPLILQRLGHVLGEDFNSPMYLPNDIGFHGKGTHKERRENP